MHYVCMYWPMIQKWHYGRQGGALKPSRVCKHIPYTLDLVCGQSLCLPCDPIYEASFMFLMCFVPGWAAFSRYALVVCLYIIYEFAILTCIICLLHRDAVVCRVQG